MITKKVNIGVNEFLYARKVSIEKYFILYLAQKSRFDLIKFFQIHAGFLFLDHLFVYSKAKIRVLRFFGCFLIVFM